MQMLRLPKRDSKPTMEAYPAEMRDKLFFDLTFEMFDCVADQRYDRLAEICDDDFGIIDINPEGGSEIIRDREGWEGWFKGLFSRIKEMNATTWSEITHFETMVMGDMGYCVADFDQILIHDGNRMRFSVIATIIWKKVNGSWKESRYHSSLVSVQPD
jgi:ketosteroid isomerase-like protein